MADNLTIPPDMEPFTYMYHGTNQRQAITESGYLNANSWFSCTLYWGDIPDRNPFGADRLLVKARDVLALFKDPHLYFIESNQQDGKNGTHVAMYHKLYLSEGPKVTGNLLSLQDNPYLVFKPTGENLVMKNNTGESMPSFSDDVRVYNWVHVQVEPAVPTSIHAWE